MALKEHDQKQIYVARQNLYDIRNVYAILTDILHKNINKVCRTGYPRSPDVAHTVFAQLRSPKGNNATAMY